MSKRDLEDMFGKYGPLKEIWLTKSEPCFAFVVFRNKEDAMDSMRDLDGLDLRGKRIRVSIARPRTRERGWGRSFHPDMRCYQCGEKGHFSKDCMDKVSDRRGSRY